MNTTIYFTRIQAVELYNIIAILGGSASFHKLRKDVQDRLLKKWPEIAEQESEAFDRKEKRPVQLYSRELRAIGVGLVNHLSRKDSRNSEYLATGAEYNFILKVAESCKIRKWLESQIENTEAVEDFDGELDDEAPLINEDEHAA